MLVKCVMNVPMGCMIVSGLAGCLRAMRLDVSGVVAYRMYSLIDLGGSYVGKRLGMITYEM